MMFCLITNKNDRKTNYCIWRHTFDNCLCIFNSSSSYLFNYISANNYFSKKDSQIFEFLPSWIFNHFGRDFLSFNISKIIIYFQDGTQKDSNIF